MKRRCGGRSPAQALHCHAPSRVRGAWSSGVERTRSPESEMLARKSRLVMKNTGRSTVAGTPRRWMCASMVACSRSGRRRSRVRRRRRSCRRCPVPVLGDVGDRRAQADLGGESRFVPGQRLHAEHRVRAGHRLAKGNWATLAELAHVGYAELTMERVAERAKTGKRRCTAGGRAGWSWCWPRFTAPGRKAASVDTGSLRGDLLAMIATPKRLTFPLVRGRECCFRFLPEPTLTTTAS